MTALVEPRNRIVAHVAPRLADSGDATAPRSSSRSRVVTAILGFGVVSMLASLPLVLLAPAPQMWRIAVTALVFLIGDTALLHIRFGNDQNSFTLSEAAVVLGLVLVPGPWLVLIAPFAVTGAHLIGRRPPLKAIFNGLSCASAMVVASGVMALFDEGDNVAVRLLALAAGALAFFGWNTITIAAAIASSQGLAFRTVYTKGLLLCLLVWLGNTSLGVLLVVLADSQPATLLVVPVLLALLYFVYWSYLRAMHERDIWQVLQGTSRELLRLEPSEIAHIVMARTPALFEADFVELLLVDSETSLEAVGYRTSGHEGTELFRAPLLPGNPFWGRVIAEREPFEVVANRAPAPQQRELAALELTKCIVAPLLVQDRCLGVLRIGFRSDVAFGRRQMQVLTTYANHLSATVNNTRLFEAVRAKALHDPLTGLANRTVLVDRLEQAQARSERSGNRVAVLFLDLDRFKVINDSLGHDAGDDLLIAVAQRLVLSLRPGDTAARFGGDEFVILCEDVVGPHEAVALAERLAEILHEPFMLAGDRVFVTASVGIAMSSGPSDDPADLLRDADAAMYEAKAHGPARFELFDKRMRQRAIARLELEKDLRRAVDDGQLRVHYQPIIRLEDECVVGVEALLRWEHPERGLIPPVEFIPLAEETGLIVPIGRWVIETSCQQLAAWHGDGSTSRDLYMSINLSPHQLKDPCLVSDVTTALLRSGVRPQALCFEVTETALINDIDAASDVLGRLRSLGVRIALDDFGTGYSSLSYLHTLPVDVLKLDQSFIARLSPELRDRAVVAGMVDLAHALDLTVVAEGVETEEQLRGLRELHCDVVQGYHYCHAKPASELTDMVHGLTLAVESGEPITVTAA